MSLPLPSLKTQFILMTEDQLVENTAGRRHFSEIVPGLQTAWDSTSLGSFKTCPRKYFLAHILSLRPKRTGTPLTFGLHYHAALERYDHLKTEGLDHEEALLETVRYITMTVGSRDLETQVWTPWTSDDDKRNYFTLMRSVVWYLDNFVNDPLRTVHLENGKPAVELSFRMEIPEIIMPGGNPVLLCGHLDKVAHVEGMGLYIVDRKTTTTAFGQRYFQQYSPGNQMSIYTLGGKTVFKLSVKGVIIDGAQVATTFTRFQRGFVNRTVRQLDEWQQDFALQVEAAENYAKRKYWPMNDTACSHYGGCEFQGICSRDPAVRDAFLSVDFRKEEWNPLIPRGH